MPSLSRLPKKNVAWLFLLPAAAFYLLVVVLPIVRSLFMSLYHLTPSVDTFVGLDNFRHLLEDPVFWQSLAHNLILLVLSLLIQIPLGMLLAVLLSGHVFGARIFRGGFFLPMMLSTVVIGLLTRELFRPDIGLVNSLLSTLGLQHPPDWFGENLALLTIIIAISWRFTGFHMMLFIAGIQSIPEDLYEAARIEGAGSWACFRHVTLPSLRPVIAVCALLSVVGSLKYFDLVFLITQGGPGHASELMTTYMYDQAFGRYEWGYASAIAVAAFLISLLAASAYMFVLRRQETPA